MLLFLNLRRWVKLCQSNSCEILKNNSPKGEKEIQEKDIYVLSPTGKKERHESTHLKVKKERKREDRCLHLRGVGTTDNDKSPNLGHQIEENHHHTKISSNNIKIRTREGKSTKQHQRIHPKIEWNNATCRNP